MRGDGSALDTPHLMRLAMGANVRLIVLLRDLRPDLPDAFIRVVERAIETDPARRPATVDMAEVPFDSSLRAVL